MELALDALGRDQIRYLVVAVAVRLPHRPHPTLDRPVSLRPRWRAQNFGCGDRAALVGQPKARPDSLVPGELDVRALHLASRVAALDVQQQSDESERELDRFRVGTGVLRSKRIDDVLVDER